MTIISSASEQKAFEAVIKVVAVGGAGANIQNTIIEQGLAKVEHIAINTDYQSLVLSKAETRLHIVAKSENKKGLGAGSDPDIGRKAAEESEEDILEQLRGGDLIFIAAGMGGGTGTGASSVVARLAKELGALVVGFVCTPFNFEGKKKIEKAKQGIAELEKHVDSLLTVHNERLKEVSNNKLGRRDAFKLCDQVLQRGIQGITELITNPSLSNVDFADVQTVLEMGGGTMLGLGESEGDGAVFHAVEQAMASELQDIKFEDARGIILGFCAGDGLTLKDFEDAANWVMERAHPDCELKFGDTYDESMGDRVRVTLIATGIERNLTEDAMAEAGMLPIRERAPLPPTPVQRPPVYQDVEMQAPPRAGAPNAEEMPNYRRRRQAPPPPSPAPKPDTRTYDTADPKNRELPAFLRKRNTRRK